MLILGLILLILGILLTVKILTIVGIILLVVGAAVALFALLTDRTVAGRSHWY